MRGLTLIELLMTLAILALLLTMAIPSVVPWIERTHADADRHTFATIIQTSRSAAIQFGQAVTLCPGSRRGCGTRNSWHLGTVAFTDRNGNRRRDEDDVLLASVADLSSRVIWRSFRNRSYLRFTPRGFTDWQNGHFLFCPQDGDPQQARQLVLNATGRLYFSQDEDRDGIHEDRRGRPLVC